MLSPFLVWRALFVSLVFVAGALAVFFYALGQGLGVDAARTMVVNTIVVLEIFYLFNVRYLHMTSFTWQGALGTPPVLIAIAVVVVAQFAFTYLPEMLIEYGDPAHLLHDYANEKDVDLVALGTHGRSALFNVLLGSVAQSLIATLPCDALVVREPRAWTAT